MSGSGGSSGSWFARLGFRKARDSGAAESGEVAAGDDAESNVFQRTRRRLLDDITSFLLMHELDVTPDNLAIAHGVFSRANPGLARQIVERIASGEAVTQPWLDAAAAGKADAGDGGLQILIARLESTLESFARNSGTARSATSGYGDALEQHVAELVQVQETGHIISSLADLAKAMLERTRRLEADMRRSESEARSLRRSLDKARRDAEVDHLTGLPNRRAFEAVLEREYRAARAALDSLVVVFCDIDHFKHINDTHGHEAGDRVIRLIADALVALSGENCHVARHGGEEFILLFRGVPLAWAKKRIDDIRARTADRRLINRKTGEPFGQVTFSAGIADMFDYADPREALRAVDAALYLAKARGRNRICEAAVHP